MEHLYNFNYQQIEHYQKLFKLHFYHLIIIK